MRENRIEIPPAPLLQRGVRPVIFDVPEMNVLGKISLRIPVLI